MISLVKAASSDPNPSNWANVEVHSVAFSALYLWVTCAVAIGSVIGASQTESAIPRLLQGYEFHMAQIRGRQARRPSAVEREETAWCRISTDRAIHGGVFSWRPTKWRRPPEEHGIGTATLLLYSLVSTVIVGIGLMTGALLSYLVPPRGLSCRHLPETMM
jgi:hypothetical protein